MSLGKITIILTAKSDGVVEVICTPSIEPILQKYKDGGELSPLEAMAVTAAAAMAKGSALEAQGGRRGNGGLILIDGKN